MALTIGFTSMDRATETALNAAFQAAGRELPGCFELVAEHAADYVVIDMDSMYGPMGWLRLHAAGKQVVGLTSAPRTQADFRLGRPFDTVMTIDLLRELAAHAGLDLAALAEAATAADTAAPPAGPEATAAVEPAPAPPAPRSAAPAPVGIAAAPPAPPSGTGSGGRDAGEAGVVADASPSPDRAEVSAPAPDAGAHDLLDWLRSDRLQGRVRLRRDGAPALWIDAGPRYYVGPERLRPLEGLFAGTLRADAFEAVDDAAWAAGTAGTPPQPLSRLVWFGALLAGGGALLPGFDPDARYRLLKWPQTEREFPRHFRIATAMMKGPATLAEIAEGSGSPLDEVTDFVNASLATGFAEAEEETPAEPAAPPRSGLFSRFIRK